jgi:hypothetical protein
MSTDSLPDLNDDVTGGLIRRLTAKPSDPTAPVTQEQLAPLQEAVARFLLTHRDAAVEKRIEARQRVLWRSLGATAATVALSIAGYAVDLASQAAADHHRVDRLEAAQAREDAERTEREEAHASEHTDMWNRGRTLETAVLRLDDRTVRMERDINTLLERSERHR